MRMRQLLFLAALCGVSGVLPFSASAITGGQPDGNGHPYVAYLDNGVFACSGTLLSPTVLITAAHCFSDSTSAFGVNSVTGAPIVRATFDPNLVNTPALSGSGFSVATTSIRSSTRRGRRTCPGSTRTTWPS